MDLSDKKIKNRPKKMLRKKKRSFWNKTFWPLCQLGVFIVATLLLIEIVITRLSKPISVYSSETKQTQALSKDLENLEKENDQLNKKIKHLKTPEGAAEAARKLGLVKPGEVSLVLPSKPAKKKAN